MFVSSAIDLTVKTSKVFSGSVVSGAVNLDALFDDNAFLTDLDAEEEVELVDVVDVVERGVVSEAMESINELFD